MRKTLLHFIAAIVIVTIAFVSGGIVMMASTYIVLPAVTAWFVGSLLFMFYALANGGNETKSEAIWLFISACILVVMKVFIQEMKVSPYQTNSLDANSLGSLLGATMAIGILPGIPIHCSGRGN